MIRIKKILTTIFVLCLLNVLFGVSNARATDITVEGDGLLVMLGDTFDYNITLTSINPDTDKLVNGDFSLFFANDFIVNNISAGSGLFFFFGSPTIGSGSVTSIEPVNLSGFGSQVVVTLNMTAPNFVTNTIMDLQDGDSGWGVIGPSGDKANVTYIDGSIAVAPEPISSLLFIIGGATLGLRRFWKRKRQST